MSKISALRLLGCSLDEVETEALERAAEAFRKAFKAYLAAPNFSEERAAALTRLTLYRRAVLALQA